MSKQGPGSRFESFADALLGTRAEAVVGSVTLWAALTGFVVHLLLWALADVFSWPIGESLLLQSPLLALYTPFSILLAYEVYQLIRVIPQSFSASMGKQFEVVIPPMAVQDGFGNFAAATTAISVTHETAPPTMDVAMSSPSMGSIVDEYENVILAFNEVVQAGTGRFYMYYEFPY